MEETLARLQAQSRAAAIRWLALVLAGRVACGYEQPQHKAEDRGGVRRQHGWLRRKRKAAAPPELADANMRPLNNSHYLLLLHLRCVINPV